MQRVREQNARSDQRGQVDADDNGQAARNLLMANEPVGADQIPLVINPVHPDVPTLDDDAEDAGEVVDDIPEAPVSAEDLQRPHVSTLEDDEDIQTREYGQMLSSALKEAAMDPAGVTQGQAELAEIAEQEKDFDREMEERRLTMEEQRLRKRGRQGDRAINNGQTVADLAREVGAREKSRSKRARLTYRETSRIGAQLDKVDPENVHDAAEDVEMDEETSAKVARLADEIVDVFEIPEGITKAQAKAMTETLRDELSNPLSATMTLLSNNVAELYHIDQNVASVGVTDLIHEQLQSMSENDLLLPKGAIIVVLSSIESGLEAEEEILAGRVANERRNAKTANADEASDSRIVRRGGFVVKPDSRPPDEPVELHWAKCKYCKKQRLLKENFRKINLDEFACGDDAMDVRGLLNSEELEDNWHLARQVIAEFKHGSRSDATRRRNAEEAQRFLCDTIPQETPEAALKRIARFQSSITTFEGEDSEGDYDDDDAYSDSDDDMGNEYIDAKADALTEVEGAIQDVISRVTSNITTYQQKFADYSQQVDEITATPGLAADVIRNHLETRKEAEANMKKDITQLILILGKLRNNRDLSAVGIQTRANALKELSEKFPRLLEEGEYDEIINQITTERVGRSDVYSDILKLLASSPKELSTSEVSARLGMSGAHISKALSRISYGFAFLGAKAHEMAPVLAFKNQVGTYVFIDHNKALTPEDIAKYPFDPKFRDTLLIAADAYKFINGGVLGALANKYDSASKVPKDAVEVANGILQLYPPGTISGATANYITEKWIAFATWAMQAKSNVYKKTITAFKNRPLEWYQGPTVQPIIQQAAPEPVASSKPSKEEPEPIPAPVPEPSPKPKPIPSPLPQVQSPSSAAAGPAKTWVRKGI